MEQRPDSRSISKENGMEVLVPQRIYVWHTVIGSQSKVYYDSVTDPRLNPIDWATDIKDFQIRIQEMSSLCISSSCLVLKLPLDSQ